MAITSKKQASQKELDIFYAYQKSKHFLNLLKDSNNFANVEIDNKQTLIKVIVDSLSYKESLLALKSIFSAKGYKRYQNQFKQFKYRQINKLKTLMIKEETYNKIKTASEEFDGVDDFLFEYLLCSRDHFIPYIVQDKLEKMPSALSMQEKAKLLFRDLPYSAKKLITAYLRHIYTLGFMDGQSVRKARTPEKKRELRDEYIGFHSHDIDITDVP